MPGEARRGVATKPVSLSGAVADEAGLAGGCGGQGASSGGGAVVQPPPPRPKEGADRAAARAREPVVGRQAGESEKLRWRYPPVRPDECLNDMFGKFAETRGQNLQRLCKDSGILQQNSVHLSSPRISFTFRKNTRQKIGEN